MTSIQNVVLGADCGGTNIKMAILDAKGKLIAKDLQPINYSEPAPAVVKNMADRLLRFLKANGVSRPKGLGIGIAGDVDPDKGAVRFSPNLGWSNVPLKKYLSRHLKFPIIVENDANCAAVGAYWLDAKRDCRNLVCLTLGTGVGGGIIIDGRLYRGATGSAGEIGHMTIDYKGRRCKCGNYGCTESLIGAWGIILSAQEGLARGEAPVLKKILKEPGMKLAPKAIAMAAKRGDRFCKELWNRTGEQLGCVMSNCVNIFNPERIILSGGVSKTGPLLLKPALAALKKRAFKMPVSAVKITISRYDENLGVFGAAYLLLE